MCVFFDIWISVSPVGKDEDTPHGSLILKGDACNKLNSNDLAYYVRHVAWQGSYDECSQQ